MNFYDRWVGLWEEAEAERAKGRRVIHYEELEWVETEQDPKIALLVAPETGFRTWGSESLRGELPPGWSSGAHAHGEEVMYIVSGQGFTVVDGVRYDWDAGSTIAIGFGATHQHFNTGDEPAVFVSAMAVHLEHFLGIHRTVQLAPHGRIGSLPDVPRSPDGKAPGGHRVVLRFEEAELLADKRPTPAAPADGGEPEVLGTVAGMEHKMHDHHLERRRFMQIGTGKNDFDVHEIEISSLMSDAPRSRGGRHAHMEAHIHFLDGEGWSLLDDDERVEWKPGSTVHIVGPQTKHQHVNESTVPSRMLRIAPGIRYFAEAFAQARYPYLYLEGKSAL